MIAGDVCTRACRFCNVRHGRPAPLNPGEPGEIARSVQLLGLKHAVITSVDRDDLPDFGAGHWEKVIREVKTQNPGVTLEVLVPDFQGNLELLQRVIDAAPEVISHNLETVARLSREIRSRATYEVSLRVIRRVAESGIISKSGIMLGLGERPEEIIQTMDDLRDAGCEVLTIGQYLRPAPGNAEVKEYILPECFDEYRRLALEKGFRHAESAPLARSSYHAERHACR
jgi:lipoic acid synthetase